MIHQLIHMVLMIYVGSGIMLTIWYTILLLIDFISGNKIPPDMKNFNKDTLNYLLCVMVSWTPVLNLIICIAYWIGAVKGICHNIKG